MRKTCQQSGITLLEAVITVAIVGVVVYLIQVGFGYFKNVMRQNAKAESSRDAQVVLFGITREVRNSKAIAFTSSDTLRLHVFDFATYGFTNPNLFEDNNIGTITYRYRSDTSGRYLERITEFPNRTQHKQFLKHLIYWSPTEMDPMFVGIGGPPPFEAVRINLYLKSPLISRSGNEFVTSYEDTEFVTAEKRFTTLSAEVMSRTKKD